VVGGEVYETAYEGGDGADAGSFVVFEVRGFEEG